MAKLRVPSLQHLARNWRDDPIQIKKLLIRIARNPPQFNYDPIQTALRDMLVFGVPYDQIVNGLTLGVRRQWALKIYLDLLPMIYGHFKDIQPDFVLSVDKRFYPVGRDLFVPFEPPLIYGLNGTIHFPWFIFWRRNPITDVRLSLFISLVDELLLQDPDLENVKFEILDFSAPFANGPRQLVVTDAKDVARVEPNQKKRMLEKFAAGYVLALEELSHAARERSDESAKDKALDRPNESPDMFDQ
ncbi:MAG: hypothetical protein WD711_09475 [Dongiaceae bacterium]